MNRNDMQALARLVIVSLTAYMLFSQFIVLFAMPIIFLTDRTALLQFVPWLLHIAVLVAIAVLLIRRSDRIAQWLTRPADTQTDPAQTHDPASWLPAAFRITCLLGGLVFLYRFIFIVSSTLSLLISVWGAEQRPEHINAWYRGQWNTLIGGLFIVPIAVYLLCGAPRFVRWHVKKTLELAAQKPDNTPIA
ncbi:MAG: hypothetical protein IH624_17890 [Phycisphaerae bacterium]|nr:hypothetical protein [Phycisphaerae bacterium]